MNNVLVTGGAGFIGSHFIDHLLKQELVSKIANIDLLTYAGSRENVSHLANDERHSFIKGDICNTGLVGEIVNDLGIDTIVNFASQSHVDRSIANPSEFVRTNIQGTYSLLEVAKKRFTDKSGQGSGSFHFHQVSTDEVYGSLGETDQPSTEISGFNPRSPYSASKASADHLVLAYYHTYGIPVTISHCTNNYGPRQNKEKLIPKIIDKCTNREPVPVYGDGKNIRDWIHVIDHCRAIGGILQTKRYGERYNIGGSNPWRNIDLVKKICSIMDQTHPGTKPHSTLITYVEDRKGHDWRYDVGTSKIRRETDWVPEIDFEEGLIDTVNWYLSQYGGS